MAGARQDLARLRHRHGRLGAPSARPPRQRGGGVAAGPATAAVAERWLASARAAGADVALIGACPGAVQDGVRIRALRRLGPLALIRALDAEDQLRPIDGVVAFGARAGLLLRAVPPGLRGQLSGITQETLPYTVNWRVREHPDVDPP